MKELFQSKVIEVNFLEDAGKRLDLFISEKLSLSRSAAQKLEVFFEDKLLSKNYRLRGGEILTVLIPKPQPMKAIPQNIPIDVIFEDEHLLVVNKPQGMVVHPAVGNYDGTLVNALLYFCDGRLSSINGSIRPGIVHRLDKDTAGLLVVAKTDFSHNHLAKQIANRSFIRVYHAVLWGRLREESGTIETKIGRHPTDRKRMAVTERNSRNAITHYNVVARYRGFTYAQFQLETGRTHQIRVHASHIGHPIVGDIVYAKGRDSYGLAGQCLFAKKIGFVHPVTKEDMEFTVPLPDFFNKLILKLGDRE